MHLHPILGGRYRLGRLLGRGGGGSVYEGLQLDLQRRVAIKLIDHALLRDPRHRERFAREAALAARLGSVHSVRVTDYSPGSPAEPAFFVMELLEGRTLAELLSASPPRLAPARAIGIALQILDALAEAHRLGFVHRNVEPSNIFVVDARPNEDLVKLLDFGLARPILGPSRTAPGIAAGALAFTAPEQREGAAVDGRADLYAVAATLYLLLTGRLAPPANATELRASAPAPSAFAPEIDPRLDAIVLRGLAGAPDHRYPTAEAFRDALLEWRALVETPATSLGPWSAGGPSFPPSTLAAPRPPKPPPPTPASNAREIALGLAAVLVFLLAVGGGAATLLGVREKQSHAEGAAPAIATPTTTTTTIAGAGEKPAVSFAAEEPPTDDAAPRDTVRPKTSRVAYSVVVGAAGGYSAKALHDRVDGRIDACMQRREYDARIHGFGTIGARVGTTGVIEAISYYFTGAGASNPLVERPKFDALGSCFTSKLVGLALTGRAADRLGTVGTIELRLVLAKP